MLREVTGGYGRLQKSFSNLKKHYVTLRNLK